MNPADDLTVMLPIVPKRQSVDAAPVLPSWVGAVAALVAWAVMCAAGGIMLFVIVQIVMADAA